MSCTPAFLFKKWGRILAMWLSLCADRIHTYEKEGSSWQPENGSKTHTCRAPTMNVGRPHTGGMLCNVCCSVTRYRWEVSTPVSLPGLVLMSLNFVVQLQDLAGRDLRQASLNVLTVTSVNNKGGDVLIPLLVVTMCTTSNVGWRNSILHASHV